MSLNDFQRTNATGPQALYQLPQASSRTYSPTHTPAKTVVVQSLARRHARNGLAHGSGLDAALV